jgi:LPS-assembly lipoprotein
MLCVLLISACGYHLRGAIELPSELKNVYIEGASTQLLEQFKLALQSSAVQMVNSRAEAGIVIVVSNEENLTRSLSLGAGGRSNQYGLEYRLNYKITNAKDVILMESSPVEIRREYFNNQQVILGKENEEATIRNEMYQQAVRTMINQIRFNLKK